MVETIDTEKYAGIFNDMVISSLDTKGVHLVKNPLIYSEVNPIKLILPTIYHSNLYNHLHTTSRDLSDRICSSLTEEENVVVFGNFAQRFTIIKNPIYDRFELHIMPQYKIVPKSHNFVTHPHPIINYGN